MPINWSKETSICQVDKAGKLWNTGRGALKVSDNRYSISFLVTYLKLFAESVVILALKSNTTIYLLKALAYLLPQSSARCSAHPIYFLLERSNLSPSQKGKTYCYYLLNLTSSGNVTVCGSSYIDGIKRQQDVRISARISKCLVK